MSHCSQEVICLSFKDLLCCGGTWCVGGAQVWQWMCQISVSALLGRTELNSEQHTASRARPALLQLSSRHLSRLQPGELLQQAGKQRTKGKWKRLETSPWQWHSGVPWPCCVFCSSPGSADSSCAGGCLCLGSGDSRVLSCVCHCWLQHCWRSPLPAWDGPGLGTGRLPAPQRPHGMVDPEVCDQVGCFVAIRPAAHCAVRCLPCGCAAWCLLSNSLLEYSTVGQRCPSSAG